MKSRQKIHSLEKLKNSTMPLSLMLPEKIRDKLDDIIDPLDLYFPVESEHQQKERFLQAQYDGICNLFEAGEYDESTLDAVNLFLDLLNSNFAAYRKYSLKKLQKYILEEITKIEKDVFYEPQIKLTDANKNQEYIKDLYNDIDDIYQHWYCSMDFFNHTEDKIEWITEQFDIQKITTKELKNVIKSELLHFLYLRENFEYLKDMEADTQDKYEEGVYSEEEYKYISSEFVYIQTDDKLLQSIPKKFKKHLQGIINYS